MLELIKMAPEAWTFTQITESIKVSAQPTYSEENSKEEESNFAWIYKIRIENLGESTIQIISRHWQIYDHRGSFEEVKGIGVVGQQPILKPNESFEYTSQVMLHTSSGLMMGRYWAVNLINNTNFPVIIPPFSLDYELNSLLVN